MKLINDKKFLKEIKEVTYISATHFKTLGFEPIKEILSKHLRALPEKQKVCDNCNEAEEYTEGVKLGYNQCISDMEDCNNEKL